LKNAKNPLLPVPRNEAIAFTAFERLFKERGLPRGHTVRGGRPFEELNGLNVLILNRRKLAPDEIYTTQSGTEYDRENRLAY
jgi:hypothetical protein